MKIYSLLFGLCALSDGTTAFFVQAPQSASKTSLSSSADPQSGLAERAQAAPSRAAAERPAPKQYGKGDMRGAKEIWTTLSPEKVQGNSLRTWSIPSSSVDRVQVFLKTDGRPLNADVELWQGPDNTPQKMAVYIEDGSFRPFRAVIETPGGSNAIAIRNTAHMEFPLDACVEAGAPENLQPRLLSRSGVSSRTIQGGAVHTYPFAPNVGSVMVLLKTDGRPLQARLELLQGPNNNKQVIELETEDGLERPFFVVIETPGTGNVVRIVNTATVEYPLTASVEPFLVESPGSDSGSIKSDFVVGPPSGY